MATGYPGTLLGNHRTWPVGPARGSSSSVHQRTVAMEVATAASLAQPAPPCHEAELMNVARTLLH